MEQISEVFQKGLEDLRISLNEEQYGQFMDFYEILVEKNKVMNLTTITEYGEVVRKHFLDSLSIVRVCNYNDEITSESRIRDLGTGSGFPGIPLKIAFPQLKIVLADSLRKRILFLDEAIEKLGLKGIETVHGRAEEMGRDLIYVFRVPWRIYLL